MMNYPKKRVFVTTGHLLNFTPVVGSSGGEGGASGSSIMEGLLTLLLSDKLNLEVTGSTQRVRNEDAEKLRAEIRQSLSDKKEPPASEAPTTTPAT